MFKTLLPVTLVFFLLAFTAGCANNQNAFIEENEIEIEVINNTREIVVSVALFYGPELDDWGEDLLDGQAIGPGDKVTFILPEGTYTLIPMTEQYYVLPAAREFSENQTLKIGAEGKHPVLVTNNTELDIHFFYMSSSDSEDWGENLLSGEVIPSGISRFFFVKPDSYDILAIGPGEERVLEEFGIDVDSDKHFEIGQ